MSSSNSGRSEGGRENQERDHRQEVTNTIIKEVTGLRPSKRNILQSVPSCRPLIHLDPAATF